MYTGELGICIFLFFLRKDVGIAQNDKLTVNMPRPCASENADDLLHVRKNML